METLRRWLRRPMTIVMLGLLVLILAGQSRVFTVIAVVLAAVVVFALVKRRQTPGRPPFMGSGRRSASTLDNQSAAPVWAATDHGSPAHRHDRQESAPDAGGHGRFSDDASGSSDSGSSSNSGSGSSDSGGGGGGDSRGGSSD